MRPRDPRHARAARARDESGWVGKVVSVLLVVVLVAAGAASWRLELAQDWWDHFTADQPNAPAGPAAVPAPPGLELAPAPAPVAVGTPLAPPGPIDPSLVQQALAPALADPALGDHVVASVVDLGDGGDQFGIGDGSAAIPASTTKVLTTTAALAALGPEHQFVTRVVSGGGNRVVLVGGGDPFLASAPPEGSPYPARADVATLAAQTATALVAQGRTRVRLGYDASLFSEPTFNPAWPDHYLPEQVVSRITALWVDEGREEPGSQQRVEDPSLFAAQVFAAALVTNGVEVVDGPTPGVADAAGQELASVQSAPLREVVQHVLETSDNEAAEVLSHQVGVATSGVGSFVDGAAGVVDTLQGLGVPADGITIYDGSGLSRQDLVTPAALVAVLRTVVDPAHPELGAVAAGLPVAGFTGSLTNRFDEVNLDARGLVRAKTGTLSNVSSLAGIAVDQDGHAMVFALMADDIAKADETKAQRALDAAAGALGACHCGVG